MTINIVFQCFVLFSGQIRQLHHQDQQDQHQYHRDHQDLLHPHQLHVHLPPHCLHRLHCLRSCQESRLEQEGSRQEEL